NPNRASAMINEVYNRRIIELAGTIPRIGRLADPDATAKAVSRLCGSTVTVDLKMDGDKVTDFAHEVKACARCGKSCAKCSRKTASRRMTVNGPISRCSSRCATTRRATPQRC